MKYLFTGLLVLSFCFANAVSFAQTIHFDHALTIGKEESDSTQYLFPGPKLITTDVDGKIYVADGSSNIIRIFDNQGKYVQSIGRRGKGLGEFLNIEDLKIKDNNLYVLDRNLRRITVFKNSPDDSDTYQLRADFSDPFAIYANNNKNLILAGGITANKKILHICMIRNFKI